jgi:hypothetical protein
MVAAIGCLHVASVDANTARIVNAFRKAGVRCLLLKGPTFSRWLYGDEGDRVYVDTDLLVPSDRFHLAEDALLEIGFSERLGSADLPPRSRHSHEWGPPEGPGVDLHWTLPGVDASSEELWHELSAGSKAALLDGVEIDGLAPPALAFHAALHAAQHGPGQGKSIEDLRRALAQCDETTWAQAAAMAERLKASSAFGTGLRLLSAGSQLASRLQVPANQSLEVALRADGPQPMTLGMQHLLETRSTSGRIRILLRAMWPSAQFMRHGSSLARKGRLGLALARLWRPARLAFLAPRAFANIRRARGQLDGRLD